MDHLQMRRMGWQSCCTALSAMGRAIVQDPENPAGPLVGRLFHDLGHESTKRNNAGSALRSAQRACHDEHRALPDKAQAPQRLYSCSTFMATPG